MSRNARFSQVGLDRLIRLQWLEQTSKLVLAGNNRQETREILQNDLARAFRSDRPVARGSLDKTITILLRTWAEEASPLATFRAQGLELLRDLPYSKHLPLHWGMIMAVYPFWSAVAVNAGRLLRLQGNVAAALVQRRIREQYGERETVSRRARYVMRSYLDWGVLQETGTRGTYTATSAIEVNSPRVIAWLAEASLRARANGSASLKDLLTGPNLFPFRIRSIASEVLAANSPRIEIFRHGLDSDLVMLKKSQG